MITSPLMNQIILMQAAIGMKLSSLSISQKRIN